MTGEYKTLLQLLQGRRSVRSFRSEPVPESMLEQIVQAASSAPSASNRQAYRFLVVTGAETRAAMAKAVRTRIEELKIDLREDARELASSYFSNFTQFEKAPLTLVPIYRTGPDLLQAAREKMHAGPNAQPGRDSLASVSAAIMNLLLGAHALGLGTCWMTGPLLAKDSLESLLQVPAGWAIAALIPVGFPAEIPDPPKRRDIDRLMLRVD